MKEFDKIHEKLDKMNEDISGIKVTQTAQAADLKYHIFRSDLNEENIELLRADVKPLIKWHENVNGGLKLIGAFTTLIAVAVGLVKLYEFLF